MESPLVVLIGLGLLLCLIYYFVLNHARAWPFLNKLPGTRRRASTASTPPYPFPSEKKGAAQNDGPPLLEHRCMLPPSTKAGLTERGATLPSVQSRRLSAAIPSPNEILDAIAPFDVPFERWSPKILTPTGISVQEIQALGDFPDYATLSGVPLPEVYVGFDIDRAVPRPYRPFRWAYHQTMSLTKLEPDWWLELERSYAARIEQRMSLFDRHGPAVLDYLPGSELACKELMEMCLQFLCTRYPHYFSLSSDQTVFHNGILKTETQLKEMHPLHVLLRNVPEDFAVMLRNPEDGHYYFRAGVICSSLGWNVGTKIGLRLSEIHNPIPDYREKMQFSMDRYFSKLPTSRPIQRGSWGLEVDTPLFMPPGDPHEQHRLRQDPCLPPSRIHLRVDWQTLRRLPLSAAIVFNFKALFTPISEFHNEPYVPALVRKILLEAKPSLMAYKSTWHVEHVVLPLLDRWAAQQVRDGLVPPDWDVKTLDEAPWFPGWREKWLGQQQRGV